MPSAKKLSSNNVVKIKNTFKKVSALFLVSFILVIGFVLYFTYMLVSNVLLNQESFKPCIDGEMEDKRIYDYATNTAVRNNMMENLKKFIGFLC